MNSFKSLYLEYCKTYNVEPQEVVKEEIKRLNFVDDETSYTFNLSSHHITDKTCMILSKLFANDQHFNTLLLNDCSLSNDGLRDICHAMTSNKSIRILELKGNNIHGDGTEHVAKMLRQNSTLKSLSLEWNSVGLMGTNAFSLFCDSLAMNKSLKDLDLRNNQMTHTSALELCRAIEANNTLDHLDLRWNNIGLVGGKGLLAALKKNFTLTMLQVNGNNIPEEIQDAIATKINHNKEQVNSKNDYSSRTQVLTNQLKNSELHRNSQVNALLSKIDLQEEQMQKTNRSMSEKMKKLQKALEDRMTTMTTLTSKLSINEADLALAEQKCSDLENLLQKLQLDKENEIKLLNAKARQEKEDIMNEKAKLERELNDSNYKYGKMEDRNKELDTKCHELQLTAYEAKEKLAQASAEYQIKLSIFDEEVKRLKQKHRDELKELEMNKAKEMENLKEDFLLNEKNLKDRIAKADKFKLSLENDISHLKTEAANEKLGHEQELHELRVKFQMEDNQKRKELEDKIRLLQISKDDLVMENNKLNTKLTEVQQKVSLQVLEIESLKRNSDSLRNSLHEKEVEIFQNNERLKTDYDKKLKFIQAEIDRMDEFKKRINELETENKQMKSDHHLAENNHQIEREKMALKIKSLEELLKKYKEEDELKNRKIHDMIRELFKPSQILQSV